MVFFIQDGVFEIIYGHFETKTVISRPKLLIFRPNIPISSPKMLILLLIRVKNEHFEAKIGDFSIKIGQNPKTFFDTEIKINSSSIGSNSRISASLL